jgi:hypothetical protein
MEKEYLIHHGDDVFQTFGSWTPFKVHSWHTHPLRNGDHLVTMRILSPGLRDELDEMETAGRITRLPSLLSGQPIGTLSSYPAFVAAGIAATDRTWDAAKKLHRYIGWQPLHPER